MKPIFIDNLFNNKNFFKPYAEHCSTICIISDAHVASLYATDLKQMLEKQLNDKNIHVLTFAAGEHSKTRETKANLEDELLSLGCGRDTLLIALGGGVTTDLVGFIAATYCRGVPVIYIPTTLMAMVDAALGGKTAVNTPVSKNMIGVIRQPLAIIIDLHFLDTLDKRHYKSGLAEIIKHAVIDDSQYFEYLEQHTSQLLARDPKTLREVIARSVEVKMAIVDRDEHEQDQRTILNFGHTVGHAIEHAADYQVLHGEAVALGMIVESHASNQIADLSLSDCERIVSLIKALCDLPKLASNLVLHKIKSALQHDKKNKGHTLSIVLLDSIGSIQTHNGYFTHTIQFNLISKLMVNSIS